MRINKIKKYILIPVICLILSVFIPLVSFADNYTYVFGIIDTYFDSRRSTDGALSRGIPEWHYSDSFTVDLTSDSPTNAINAYLLTYSTSKNSGNTCHFNYNQYINTNGYDYFTNTFIITSNSNSASSTNVVINSQNYYNGSYSTIHTITLSFSTLINNSTYSDEYGNLLWSIESFVVSDGNNNSYTFYLISMGSSYISGACDRVYVQIQNYFQSNDNNYVEILMPIYAFRGYTSSSGDTSGDSSDTSGSGSSVDLTEIEDELADMNQGILDTITAVNSVEDKIDDMTSQLIGDDYSTDESAVDNMGLQVSELDNNFSDHDIDLSNGIDNLNSFDESDLFDDIESAFNDLDNADGHNDMHYTSFVQQLYSTLGIGTYLLFLVPFCMIFVLFKFVLGGVV